MTSKTLTALFDLLEQAGGFDRRDRCVPTGVAHLSAGAIESLLHVLRREHAEDDRHARLHSRLTEAAGRLVRDELEVRPSLHG